MHTPWGCDSLTMNRIHLPLSPSSSSQKLLQCNQCSQNSVISFIVKRWNHQRIFMRVKKTCHHLEPPPFIIHSSHKIPAVDLQQLLQCNLPFRAKHFLKVIRMGPFHFLPSQEWFSQTLKLFLLQGHCPASLMINPLHNLSLLAILDPDKALVQKFCWSQLPSPTPLFIDLLASFF